MIVMIEFDVSHLFETRELQPFEMEFSPANIGQVVAYKVLIDQANYQKNPDLEMLVLFTVNENYNESNVEKFLKCASLYDDNPDIYVTASVQYRWENESQFSKWLSKQPERLYFNGPYTLENDSYK